MSRESESAAASRTSPAAESSGGGLTASEARPDSREGADEGAGVDKGTGVDEATPSSTPAFGSGGAGEALREIAPSAPAVGRASSKNSSGGGVHPNSIDSCLASGLSARAKVSKSAAAFRREAAEASSAN